MKLYRQAAAVVAVLFVSCGSTISAQQTTGAICGVVTDPANALVAGVKLTATNEQTLSRVAYYPCWTEDARRLRLEVGDIIDSTEI
jgi:hypothetical protein